MLKRIVSSHFIHVNVLSSTKKYIFWVFFLALSLWQCQPEQNIPDVSNIEVDLKIRRFEQDLFQLDPENLELPFAQQVELLRQKYPNFFVVFKHLIDDTNQADSLAVENIAAFIRHPSVRKLYDTTQVIYNNISDVESDLKKAFRYFKYYFPERPVPEVVSYISEYSVGTFTYGDSLLGIGWDFFLGETFPYHYDMFPAFLQRSMNRQHLVAKAMEAVAFDVVGEVTGKRLLDYMINNGKMLYVKSLLLPTTSDSILMEWKTRDVQWITQSFNERELWTQILKRNLLYSTRRTEFDKLIGASPMGTTWMPPESPGKTANWLGWQIVKAYMKQHPEMSVQELIAIDDPQIILDGANYRPPK
jgi:hypothetical protein